MNTNDQKMYRDFFGPRVVEARQALGLTQTELCELLNINRPTLSKLELGNTGCDAFTLILLTRALRVDIDYFVPESAPEEGEKKTLKAGLSMLKRGSLMVTRAQRIIDEAISPLIGSG